ncbi:MAG: arylamine N-acetyltransferase [Gammaproteobacteria bacterium]|nr:arylamine N-acetyltransferase [Gammaproteobacteria bacterium]
MTATPLDLPAYFSRIGYRGTPAVSASCLRELHIAHVGAIAFENIESLNGRQVDLAPQALFDKLVSRRRGGYCFEQNGLFAQVLQQLGFRVQGLAARVVHGGGPPRPRTHQLLQVDIDGVAWLADVGFGRLGLLEPMVMAADSTLQSPAVSYQLRQEADQLTLAARERGDWFDLYTFTRQPQLGVDFEMANWFTANHPQSPFRRELLVARVTPQATYLLHNGKLQILRPGSDREILTLADREQVRHVLADYFDLDIDADDLALFPAARAMA